MRPPSLVSLLAVPPLLTLLVMPLAAIGQVYKWQDANGKTHYSDQPPVDAKTKGRRLGPANSASDDTTSAAKSVADKRLDASQREAEAKDKAATAERERAEDAQRAQACERARMNLQGLESGQIRYRMGASGEREALDGAVRDAEIANAQRNVETSCALRPAAAKK